MTMTLGRWVGVILLVIGTAYVVSPFYVRRRFTSPVFRSLAPMGPGVTIDTSVVVPSTGRYQVRLDFSPSLSSSARRRLLAAPLPFVYRADIEGRSWSVDSTDRPGTYRNSLLVGGPLRIQAGERLHFTGRTLPSFATLADLQPYLVLRRDVIDEMRMEDRLATWTLGGILSLLAGLVFLLRRSTRRKTAAA